MYGPNNVSPDGTFQVRDGYAKRLKTQPTAMLTVRYLTLDECKHLYVNGHTSIIANDGSVRTVKITSVKVWKTRPQDVVVGVKYGLYEYASFSAAECVTRFVRVLADSRDGMTVSTPDGDIRL